jgi:hypothetical protein
MRQHWYKQSSISGKTQKGLKCDKLSPRELCISIHAETLAAGDLEQNVPSALEGAVKFPSFL